MHILFLRLATMAMSRQSLPPVNQYTGSYTEDVDGDGVRLNAFDHEDASIAYDPLSANRRFAGAADLAVLGTLVFAGPTCHSISVMVPDCLLPPVDNIVRIDLRHHVGLSLGPAVDMTRWSPEAHLDHAMCPGPLLDTLELQRREFWGELGPILKKWKCINGSKCPDCGELIKINMGRHVGTSGDSFRISALQREDPVCVTLHDWVLAEEFPAWAEVKSMLPELRSLWHHRNNLSVDDNGTLWRKRSSQSAQLQLLVPKAGREQLFLSYHASLFGGHLGRTRTLARLADRFYWTGMADDVKDWLSQCVACIKRKSPVGRHHPLGHIPTGHRWDRIAMDILDVCDPTPEGFRYILVIADYFSKWTEAFPMKNKCADTVADILVEKIILRFGMPLVIHSDQGREFENGLMKSLCALLGCTKTRTAPYHPESDGMIERFNRTCLMMLSMFVNDRRDNWHELLPFIMHAYRTSVHESTGYSPFRLMMGEECSLPQDVSTAELRTQRENDVAPHPFATWVRDALEVAYDHVWSSLKKTASRRKRLYDTKAVDRKFPVGSWVLRYYPPAAQHKLGSPWVGPHQVVRQATGHTVGIQRDPDKPIIFVHVDDLKLCPGPRDVAWTPGVSTAKSLCASTVAFRPGSDAGDVTLDPSVDVSAWEETSVLQPGSDIINDLDKPIDLDGHILSPFYPREIIYQNCTFLSIAHLMCYRYAIINNQKAFATGIRKWSRPLRDFPTPKFSTTTEIDQWRIILEEIYAFLCINNTEMRSSLIRSGPRPFTVTARLPWGPETNTVNPCMGWPAPRGPRAPAARGLARA